MSRKEEVKSKFLIGDLVVYCGGLFQVVDILYNENNETLYKIGDGTINWIYEDMLIKADWRDQTRILGKGNKAVK